MAVPNRLSDPKLQSLHDFYEPLVILRILGPLVGPRTQGSLRTSSSTEESHTALRIFLDRLSWLCDYEPGGDTVSAIALEKGIECATAWLATSFKAKETTETHLSYLLGRLQDSHTLSAADTYELEQEICIRSINLAHKRVRRYTQLFRGFVEQSHDILKTSDPLLDQDLTSLANLVAMPTALCAAADRFRYNESLKLLSRRISETTSPSMWSLLRHYIGRLGSWHRASRTLVEYACKRPEIFKTIEVQVLSTPKAVPAPFTDEFTNLSSALSRMYAAEEQRNLQRNVQALQRRRNFDLDAEFRTEYRDKNFKPRVHAEAWLLEQFHDKGLVFLDDDKYIGCSKPSCYCCSLYFQNHPGGFAQRPSHGNVWTNWQSPLHQDVEKETENGSIMSAMTQKFREDLKIQLGSPTANQERVPDSTTGMTLSNA